MVKNPKSNAAKNILWPGATPLLARVSRQNPFGLRGSLPATVCAPCRRTSHLSRVRSAESSHLISIRAPLIYAGFKYTYTLFLFTTPYIGYSLVLSGLYVFAFRPNRKIKPMPLPAYPDPSRRDELFLVLGEVHDPRKPVAAEHPYWLAIPERGLFTGIAIFGAIGTGKTSGCMYPYAEQLIAYRRDDPDK